MKLFVNEYRFPKMEMEMKMEICNPIYDYCKKLWKNEFIFLDCFEAQK